MKYLLRTTLVAICATLPAAAQPRPERPCLRQIDIYSFEPVPGNRSLIVEDRRHRHYRVSFMGICNGLQFDKGLAFKTNSTSNLSCLERGDSVIHRDPGGPPRCVIQDIQYQAEPDRADHR